MQRRKLKVVAASLAAACLVGVGAVALADTGGRNLKERLSGFEEVPALSTPGVGEFRASINRSGEIRWELTFSGMETPVTQAHIHFENETNNGPVVVFFCSNLGNGPAGTQACPAAGGTITGTITAADVGAGGAAQGLAAGELAELVSAIRAGATYVNVHTVARPGGEIRAQLGDAGHHGGHDDG
ncbi:MAG: CHRD domain-containing protein [Acidimicrobiales bacterium]